MVNKVLAVALALGTFTAFGAQAAPTIVNLNASSTNPNAGTSSPGFPYNPYTLSLVAGTYNVKVVGVAGGGLYNAYTVSAPTGSNNVYTDSMWSVSFDNGASAAFTQGTLGRYTNAADALAAYAPAPGYTFTLNSTQTVAFYVDDTAYPYFADDTGGVSLAVNNVPEPATMALLLTGAAGLVLTRRKSAGTTPGATAAA